MSDPGDRWTAAAMPVYSWAAALSSLIWFGFAVGAGITGHPVLAVLFAVVGALILGTALRLWRRFKHPGR